MEKEKTKCKKMNGKLFFHSFLWFGILMVVIDFVTKWLCQGLLEYGQQVTIIPNFFYVTLSNNTGMAWGKLSDNNWGRYLLIAISLIMSIGIFIYWRKTMDKNTKPVNAAISLVWAGAFGNLIDRAIYFWPRNSGLPFGVIDWIQFYLGGGPAAGAGSLNPFPTFNWADSCVVVGAIMLVIISLIHTFKEQDKEDEEIRIALKEKKDDKE